MKIKEKGFTLIELLVVISIIGILTTIVTANLSTAQARARDGRRITDLKTIATGLEFYYTNNYRYPAPGTTNGSFSFSNQLIDPNDSSTVYIKNMPNDPRNTGEYEYFYCTTSSSATNPYKTYNLYAKLENTRDSNLYCGVSGATSWSSVSCDQDSLNTVCRGALTTNPSGLSFVQNRTNYSLPQPD